VDAESGLKALRRVADPELSVNIVDLGLVYGLEVRPGFARVKLTMTSASCPVTEVIVADVYDALGGLLGEGADIDVDVVWDPPWGPERMSEKARSALGWDES
jgi:metal-sulfur cluster biosynthetic enzyme